MAGSVTQRGRRFICVLSSSHPTSASRHSAFCHHCMRQRTPILATLRCGIGRRAPPATPRHTRPPLRLLPSGPDRIHGFALRGDRRGPPLSDRSAVPEQGEQNNRAVNIRQGRSRDGLAHQARGRIRTARSGQRCRLSWHFWCDSRRRAAARTSQLSLLWQHSESAGARRQERRGHSSTHRGSSTAMGKTMTERSVRVAISIKNPVAQQLACEMFGTTGVQIDVFDDAAAIIWRDLAIGGLLRGYIRPRRPHPVSTPRPMRYPMSTRPLLTLLLFGTVLRRSPSPNSPSR